jgi:hypothetical protein
MMSSKSSSEETASDGETQPGSDKVADQTPCTSVTPLDLTDMDQPDLKTLAASSSGRSTHILLPSSTIPRDSAVLSRNDRRSLPYGTFLHDFQAPEYIKKMEEHIELLQMKLQEFESARSSHAAEKADEFTPSPVLSTQPQWMTWQEYLEPISDKPTSILEILIEKPHTNSRRKNSVHPHSTDFAHAEQTSVPGSVSRKIERIRIRSPHIIEALQRISGHDFPSSSCLIILSPFKIFLQHEDSFREYLAELQHNLSQRTSMSPGPIFMEPTTITRHNIEPAGDLVSGVGRETEHSLARATFSEAAHELHRSDEGTRGTDGIERIPTGDIDGTNYTQKSDYDVAILEETVLHLESLLKFLDLEMRPIIDRHRQLQSCNSDIMIAFDEIEALYNPGDLVVTDNVDDQQIYCVSIQPPCDLLSARRHMRSDGEVEIVSDETVRTLLIDCFYIDFNGKDFGPVEIRFSIRSYEGQWRITELPLYPLRCRKDAEATRSRLLERGSKFRDLSIKGAHREYNGLSLMEPKEQVS